MKIKNTSHNQLYNNLLFLSRNKFFYESIKLPDTFETRIYLMFFHFSILMIVFKKKGKKFDQKKYDKLFHSIEYNLRELGFGDVSVNKKMKELNKILYDILLKLDLKKSDNKDFSINYNIVKNYFFFKNSDKLDDSKQIVDYFVNFFDFCFELSLDSVVNDMNKFEF